MFARSWKIKSILELFFINYSWTNKNRVSKQFTVKGHFVRLFYRRDLPSLNKLMIFPNPIC